MDIGREEDRYRRRTGQLDRDGKVEDGKSGVDCYLQMSREKASGWVD